MRWSFNPSAFSRLRQRAVFRDDEERAPYTAPRVWPLHQSDMGMRRSCLPSHSFNRTSIRISRRHQELRE
jgi:hypothetical protein